MICILARRGRFLETILQDGARSGVPRTRREPHRREVRTPTARPLRLAREAAAAPVSHCRRRKRGSRPKTATVERREGSRSPRDRVVARRRRDRTKECACRRSIHPSSGGRNCCCRDGRWRQCLVGSPADAKAKAHAKRRRNPGAATRRGNEEHCAVSHREYDDGQRFAVRAPRCRTRRARSTPVARRMQTARRSGSVVFRTAQR